MLDQQARHDSTRSAMFGLSPHLYLLPLLTVGTILYAQAAKATERPMDSTPHKIFYIPVQQDVKLEVVDWGGTGSPLVLLAGLGDNAHVFDKFAPRFTAKHHVFGISRRGFGTSSAPPPSVENYTADRLGDDVLTVIDSLQLDRPILIGHSIAGEELSSIGSRHPEKVSGLVYLDAGNPYAFYDKGQGNLNLDALALKTEIDDLITGPDPRQAVADMLTELPRVEKELKEQQEQIAALPSPPVPPVNAPKQTKGPTQAILLGEQKYTSIPVPILAIFAVPHDLGTLSTFDAKTRAAIVRYDSDFATRFAEAFQRGLPTSHVIRIVNANHYIFRSNEEEVVKDINDFLATLAGATTVK